MDRVREEGRGRVHTSFRRRKGRGREERVVYLHLIAGDDGTKRCFCKSLGSEWAEHILTKSKKDSKNIKKRLIGEREKRERRRRIFHHQ